MLSRVAETLYWMQRYRERAENTARLLEVNLHLSIDAPIEIGNQWEPMIQTTGGQELFDAKYKTATEKNVIRFLTFDLENPNSILNCLRQSRENARSVREAIPSEIWDEINTTYLFCQKAGSSPKKEVPTSHLFSRIRRQCQLITAVADTSMSRNEAWYFGRIGNLIERADMTTRILDVKYFMLLPSPKAVGTPFDNIQWRALLKSASGLDTFQKMWHQITPEHVVEFLILNKDFPRSVLSCLDRVEESLNALVGESEERGAEHPHQVSRRFLEELQTMTGKTIIKEGLHEFIDDLQIKLSNLDAAIFKRYFSLLLPHKV